MLRKHGLSVDHVLDAKLVDVNGIIFDKESMGEDLSRAIRGGGGATFGVILSYKIKLIPVLETVSVFRIERSLDEEENVTDIVYKWQQVAPTTDDNLWMRMLIQPVSSKVNKGEKTIRISILTMFLGNAEELVALLDKDFPELGLKKEGVMEMSWIEILTRRIS